MAASRILIRGAALRKPLPGQSSARIKKAFPIRNQESFYQGNRPEGLWRLCLKERSFRVPPFFQKSSLKTFITF
ncbi:hypothetical protein [Komagataeibacter medellinensis]|uniref:hypothetical protein n=1 Tax=Komagataeibacter medellinensis TaxID=1177712 RepID=UPI00039E6612|nr:hypothetical protein [Komagataeibacter medellinensis]